jgi:death on curing protein
MLRATLFQFNKDISATMEDKYKMTIAASAGEIRFDEIKNWIEERIVEIDS